MERISLHDNSLSGTLPTELGSLLSVAVLELHDNNLSGSIPSEVGSLRNATNIMLQSNLLTGTIPVDVSTLLPGANATMSRLFVLNVTDNPLSEGTDQDECCWINSTFFEGEDCASFPGRHLSLSCWCSCNC